MGGAEVAAGVTQCGTGLLAVTLELGGKSPQVIFEDADFDAAVASVCNAIIQNSGQTCSAGARVLIQKSIWDRFTAALKTRFESLKAGSPEMDLDLGPVISAIQKQRIEGFLDRAQAAGVPLIARGTAVKRESRTDATRNGRKKTPTAASPT